jgi:hypothetical protein
MTDRRVRPCLRAGSGSMDRMGNGLGKSANAATMGVDHRDGPEKKRLNERRSDGGLSRGRPDPDCGRETGRSGP